MRTEHTMLGSARQAYRVSEHGDQGAATLGTFASLGALFSAAACCILPLALAAIGVGSVGLSSVIPFHWPLTIVALVAVSVGWLLYLRKRSEWVQDHTCTTASPTKSTFVLLCAATILVMISACWPFIEAPLMRALRGA